MNVRFLKRIAVTLSVLVLVGALSKTALAGEGYQIITTDELKNRLNASPTITLIYSLSYIEFLEQRIPGSIGIPMELMANSVDMPADKNQAIAFYCKGPG